jgi:hypothetical protein
MKAPTMLHSSLRTSLGSWARLKNSFRRLRRRSGRKNRMRWRMRAKKMRNRVIMISPELS